MRPTLKLGANPLQIANERVREAVLKGVSVNGPPTLRSRWARARYNTPEGLNEAFEAAKELTDKESKRQAALAADLSKQIAATQDVEEQRKLTLAREKALVKEHLHNPEVRFNHLVQAKNIDMSVPIYRHLARGDWARREMLVLMQRIEQHHMIPDTLPTLDPRARVQLRFLTPARKWIEPGVVVSTGVSERLPQLQVQEFEPIQDGSRYTVLIVNPDVPDLENDTYKTGLHFAAVDVPLSNASSLVNWDQGKILQEYVPPHPEKNAGAQRFCVWVLRQPNDITETIDPATFNLREFVARNNLDAVGAHMWRSQYDHETDSIREKYGLGAGNVYFRARTAKPEEALQHIRHRKQWIEKLRHLSPAAKEETQA